MLAGRFFELFRGLDRAYGTYTLDPNPKPNKPKQGGKARTITGAITQKLWEQHLAGITGLGVVPICADNTCLWGALDIDKYDLDFAEIEKQIESLELPLTMCRTKSGGLHLYMFTSEPVPAALIQSKLSTFAAILGFPDTEVFPKQIELGGPKDVGNWINMPYFDHTKTNRYAFKDGEQLSAEQFLELAESRKISHADLKELNPEAPFVEFSDGPPCLQKLAQIGFPEGSRNHALFSIGVYYRSKYSEGWEDKVFKANDKWMSGTPSEVMGIIKSLNKKGYKYKCSDQPLSGHCHRGICAKRQHGIPDQATKRDEAKKKRPCILEVVDKPVTCYEPPPGSNDDPYWVFKINGKKLSLNKDHIRIQAKFLDEYFRHFHRIILPVEDQRWADVMNELLETEEVMEQPRDAGPEGQLYGHLEAYCTGRVQAKDRDELAMDKPWTNGGRTYFRQAHFTKYLDQQRFRAIPEKEVWPTLKRGDLQHHQFNIKGRCIQCWSVPAYSMQTESFDVPDVPISDDDKPF